MKARPPAPPVADLLIAVATWMEETTLPSGQTLQDLNPQLFEDIMNRLLGDLLDGKVFKFAASARARRLISFEDEKP